MDQLTSVNVGDLDYLQLQTRLRDLKKLKAKAFLDWQKLEQAITTEERKCLTQINFLALDLNVEMITLAKTVVYVQGTYADAGADRESVITDAITWFVEGGIRYNDGNINYYKSLWSNYLGTKDYDRWHGQREDHSYGYSPAHGHIIFAVGLQPEKRLLKGASADPRITFTTAEREAVVYYLSNLARIEKASCET